MVEQGAALVQYIFLDVVKFTQGRTIEAQVDVIEALNRIAKEALQGLDEQERILLPTGDGIAIAILKAEPFDLALQVAQVILSRLNDHNETTPDERRKFEVRVGINQNIDNIITDINGSRNVAGRGINMAQRIMSHAEGGQILVGETVFDILCEREAYANSFRELPGRDKHGNRFRVFQFIRDHAEGLKTALPAWAQPTEPSKPRSLTAYQAHFIANAVCHRSFLIERRKETMFEQVSAILLHLLALDSIENSSRHPFQERSDKAGLISKGSLAPMYEKIDKSEFWVIVELGHAIVERLTPDCFEQSDPYTVFWAFPSENGKRRAQVEAPEIWKYVLDSMQKGAERDV